MCPQLKRVFLLGVFLLGVLLAYSGAVAGAQTVPDTRVTNVFASSMPGPALDLEWVVYLGTSGNDTVEGMAADDKGNLYVAGCSDRNVVSQEEAFLDFARVNIHPHPKATGFFGYIAKLDPSGAVVWISYLTAEGHSFVADVAADNRGNVYAVGWGGLGLPGSSSERTGVYTARLSAADGSVTWATRLGIVDWPVGFDPAICVDAEGHIYVAHHTDLSWAGNLVGAKNRKSGGGDACVTKLSPQGAVLWSSFIGGEANEAAYGVATDGQGNVYVVGDVRGAGKKPNEDYRLAGFPNAWRGGSSDGFAACLDANGTVQWTRLIGGGGDDACRRIALAANGNLIVAAGYSMDANEPRRGPRDHGGPFFARLDNTGNVLWTSHGQIFDRAGVGGLALSTPGESGQRAFMTTINVDGLGVSQINTETGDTMRSTSYADLLSIVQIGARHMIPAGRPGAYYLADATTFKNLPKAINALVGCTDVFVAKVTEKITVAPDERRGAIGWSIVGREPAKNPWWGKTVHLRSHTHPDWYLTTQISTGDSAPACIAPLMSDKWAIQRAAFTITDGLAKPGAVQWVSFESAARPGFYLRRAWGDRIFLWKYEEHSAYREEATFRIVAGLANPDWQSLSCYPATEHENYIRQKGLRCYTQTPPEDTRRDPLFKQDATFFLTPTGSIAQKSPDYLGSLLLSLLGKSLRLKPSGQADKAFTVGDDNAPVYIAAPSVANKQGPDVFKTERGLAEFGLVSFQSAARPDHYLRHGYYVLRLSGPFSKDDQLLKEDASFEVVPGLSGRGISLRSYNYPNHFLRFRAAEKDIALAEPGDATFSADATFLTEEIVPDPWQGLGTRR